MIGTILLDYNCSTREVEDEEKNRFLFTLLQQCFDTTEVAKELQDIWSDNLTLTPNQKIKLRSILSKYNILVRDDNDGGLKIYLEKELIGSFKKPRYVLKKQADALEPRKRYYLEMFIECWSMFNEETEEAEAITDNPGS